MIRRFAFATAILAAVAFSLAGCGGSSDKDDSSSGSGGSQSSGQVAVPGDAPYSDVIAKAGFKPILFTRFPAQKPGRKATIVVYRDKSDKDKGGVLYLQGNTVDDASLSWHWYFENGAPDSIRAAELNGDGFWDVVVHLADGKTVDLIQETDFTLMGNQRDDLIALNAASSQPEGLWKCFDGDTATFWSAGGAEGYVEVSTPLGVSDGILIIRLSPDANKQKCEVFADGKKVQEIELESTDLEQRIQLDDGVKRAGKIKLEIKGDGAGISELAIR